MKQQFKTTHQIRTYETGADGCITASNMVHLLQDAAGRHAEELGWSVRELHSGGRTWVLQRFYTEFLSYPKDGETITIHTYPSGVERLYAFRDYYVTGPDGNIIVKATSSWVILNLETRRVMAPPEDIAEITSQFGDRTLHIPSTRLTPFNETNPDDALAFRVRKHDLDLNRHVNNVRYVEWALESVPDEVFDQKKPVSVDVVFKAECFYGDEILSSTAPGPVEEFQNGKAFFHMLWRKSDEKTVCLVHSRWK